MQGPLLHLAVLYYALNFAFCRGDLQPINLKLRCTLQNRMLSNGGENMQEKKEIKKTENIKLKVAWCVETDIKYTLTVLVILQPWCITMILYFKWQNLLVSCVGSELFKSVIARGICASL